MPISISTFPVQTNWQGCTWSVPSKSVLAKAVATVAVGQARHLSKILHSGGIGPLPTSTGAVQSAISLLTPGANVYHRDGWIFQVMSWLAAQMYAPRGLMSTPQMMRADKGLDGLQIVMDAANEVSAVVIFEDKATENPRKTVLQKVWPEFKKFEAGQYQNLLTASATDILERAGHPEPSEAVARILWSQVKQYRLSISDVRSTDASRADLLDGYATFVPGQPSRRRAEIFEVADVRVWMADLAALAIAEAQAMVTVD